MKSSFYIPKYFLSFIFKFHWFSLLSPFHSLSEINVYFYPVHPVKLIFFSLYTLWNIPIFAENFLLYAIFIIHRFFYFTVLPNILFHFFKFPIGVTPHTFVALDNISLFTLFKAVSTSSSSAFTFYSLDSICISSCNHFIFSQITFTSFFFFHFHFSLRSTFDSFKERSATNSEPLICLSMKRFMLNPYGLWINP